MKEDRNETIEASNTEFYRAIEAASIERMDEVWDHEESVRCVHPGWDLISGWGDVRESWLRIFEGAQKMRISPTEVAISAVGDFGWVTCKEEITVFNKEGFDSVEAVATNLFMRRGNCWRLVHHHASPIPTLVPHQSSEAIQ